jgi:hypothetical protein
MPNATAIAGVSPSHDTTVTSFWPSIAANPLGRLIGSICNLIPLKINGVTISALLFALPLSPLAALIYLWMKVFGTRYVLTRKSISSWSSMGHQLYKSVPLSEIVEIEINEQGGQAFYRAADLELLAADGAVLLRMSGISHPKTARQIILETRQAEMETAASLETIQKRAK